MEKKIYSTPKATKVKLIVKESVLGTCHASPVLTPKEGGLGCNVTEECWTGPGH